MTSIDTRGDIPAQLQNVATEYLSTWRGDDAAGPIPAGARDTVSAITRATQDALSTARDAVEKAASLDADNTLYPEGRDQKVEETMQAARERIQEQLATAEAAYSVAAAELFEAVKLPLDRRDATTARQDAQMILDGPRDKGGMFNALQAMAARQDGVGALVSSPWLRDYLTARGEDAKTIEAMETIVRDTVLRAAAKQDTDRVRQGAAQAALALPRLAKARVAAQSATRMTMESFTSRKQRQQAARQSALSAGRVPA